MPTDGHWKLVLKSYAFDCYYMLSSILVGKIRHVGSGLRKYALPVSYLSLSLLMGFGAKFQHACSISEVPRVLLHSISCSLPYHPIRWQTLMVVLFPFLGPTIGRSDTSLRRPSSSFSHRPLMQRLCRVRYYLRRPYAREGSVSCITVNKLGLGPEMPKEESIANSAVLQRRK